ncbi:hypothetical protein D0Y65_026658 [Glycine soja]|uniref:Uncharacterized protein n=1 Tax=Glycine soja TaxID=3848 RepID=A0A445IKU0_GLYSO|nr:hypothetical protein D0Y65_026658 [Glycine soja]
MARSPDKIMNIDGSKETLKLAVRISDLWFVGMPDKSEQAKMVFVDSDSILDDLPFRKYRFAGFANVVAGQSEPGLLVDIISVMDEVVFHHVSGVVFKLKDLDDHEGHGPITVLLTHGRIKDAQGSYPPSVSNSFKASKLIINQLVMEIQEFNERRAKLGIEARSVFKSHGQGSSQLSGSTQLSSKESFFGKTEAKTIAEINTISELAFNGIKKLMQRWRPSHVHVANTIRKYRLEVMINHKDESTKFLLWDRECTELIGQSADAVDRHKIADGDVDLNTSPQALDKLLGYVLAFKIKQSTSVTADHDPLLGLWLSLASAPDRASSIKRLILIKHHPQIPLVGLNSTRTALRQTYKQLGGLAGACAHSTTLDRLASISEFRLSGRLLA